MATDRAIPSGKGPQVAIPRQFGNLEAVRVDTRNWEAVFRVRASDGLIGPEFTTRLSMIQPLSDEDTQQFWKMLVDDVMRILKEENKFPAFVKGYEVTTGEDSTGDPAAYVEILISPQREYPSKTVAEWGAFSNLVHERLMALRLQRYPYVQIGEKRKGR